MLLSEETQTVRLDKWLWSARFFKTRSLATDAVSSGKVLVDGSRAKPARQISVGQNLVIRKGPFEYSVQVLRLIEKRVGAKDAQTTYSESEESIEKRNILQEKLKDDRILSQGERLAGRPNKRDRRLIHRFKSQDAE
jgi:ribosome-associated heat shock protein Hsp15